MRNYTGALVFASLLLAGWELGARWADVPYMLPAPSQIGLKLWELRSILLIVHLPATLQIIFMGLFISVVMGVMLAVWMNRSLLVDRTLYPLIIFSQTIPVIALAPVFVLWFGYSIWSKVAVTVLITFFPITVTTYDGLRSASRELQDLMRTMGGTSGQIFRKALVPSALPSFLSGLKVAVTLSVMGAAVGEWLGGNAGLGYFSRRMMTQFDGAGIFAPIVLLSLVGLVLFGAVKMLEKWLLKWKED